MPSPPAASPAEEIPSGGNPATTDMLPPPPFPDATTTASIEFSGKSDIFPEISSWAPREMPTQPGAASPPPELREDKTERLDDVIEKLRLQSHKAPLPPLEPPAAPRSPSSPGRTLDVRPDDASQAAHHTGENTPMTPAIHRSAEHVAMAPASLRTSPMAPASERTSPMVETPHRSGEQAPRRSEEQAARRSGEQAPAPRQKPAGRLFVYGEPPPGAVVAPSPAAPRATASSSASAPAPRAATPAASGLRLPSFRVGLIVAAIVVLFAAVLFVLVALARRGAAGEAPRSGRGGSPVEIAATA